MSLINPAFPNLNTLSATDKVIVILERGASEGTLSYQERISKIQESFSENPPELEIREETSLTAAYDRILQTETDSGEKKVVVLTLSNNSSEESFKAISDWHKTHTVANQNLYFQNPQESETPHSSSIFANQLERTLATQMTDSTSTSELHLPVINMENLLSSDSTIQTAALIQLRKAITTNGFFAVQNVGIDPSIIEESYAQSKQFFDMPMEFKRQIDGSDVDYQRGYKFGEKAKGALEPDKKEFIHIGSHLHERMSNKWPAQPGFQDSMTRMYEALAGYVTPLLEATIKAINLGVEKEEDKLPLSYFEDKMGYGANSLLRTIHYPPVAEEENIDPNNPPLGAAAHTDIDLLTILPPATAKGLQVMENGKWHTVVVPPDSFVVNMGDMFTHITNGLIKSSIHRVLAGERQSQVFFAHPLDFTDLSPLPSCVKQTGGIPLYSQSNRLELLFERLIELFGDKKLLGIYARMGHIEKQIAYGKESSEVLRLLTEAGYILGTWKLLDENIETFTVPSSEELKA